MAIKPQVPSTVRKGINKYIELTPMQAIVGGTSPTVELQDAHDYKQKVEGPQSGGKSPKVLNQKSIAQQPQMLNQANILKNSIKKYDPQNSSGAVKPAVDIMMKLMDNLKKKNLQTNINPPQVALGGSLFNQLQKANAQAQAIQKMEDDDIEIDPLIVDLIATAIEKINETAPDISDLAAQRLNIKETLAVQKAYFANKPYVSNKMPPLFVQTVNSLFVHYRAQTA